MDARSVSHGSTASAVGSLVVDEYAHDGPRISIPRPELQLVVRCGPTADQGLDVHASGARQTVHRKFIRGGQWSVTARLRLGSPRAVVGVTASAMAGRIVALEDLWGDAAARRLRDRLATAREPTEAAKLLKRALTERCALGTERHAQTQLALAAADRLGSANVDVVAAELGVSPRHLRRIFRETVGLSPKAFAKLTRFHRALRLARGDSRWSWASIAAAAGYYDQAHLIADFHALAQATPRALLRELQAAPGTSHDLAP
ncbi:MAG: AraC family transcriptional regulator [Labilithrix sp.]|nr:AraC family transcriptional regulator [Labilithrix sp.]